MFGQTNIQPLIDWIQMHPNWAWSAVFLISLSESLAVIGLIVPGIVMMTAIGALIGAGVLAPLPTLSWAVLGAIVGDSLSYSLGHHFHEHLRDMTPFRQFPRALERGSKFFQDHGGKSVILGRFLGPIRPVIPVVAGMMDMPTRQFLFANIFSAIVWAPVYCFPGFLVGLILIGIRDIFSFAKAFLLPGKIPSSEMILSSIVLSTSYINHFSFRVMK